MPSTVGTCPAESAVLVASVNIVTLFPLQCLDCRYSGLLCDFSYFLFFLKKVQSRTRAHTLSLTLSQHVFTCSCEDQSRSLKLRLVAKYLPNLRHLLRWKAETELDKPTHGFKFVGVPRRSIFMLQGDDHSACRCRKSALSSLAVGQLFLFSLGAVSWSAPLRGDGDQLCSGTG